jgi:hypothetical protein
MRQLPTRPNLEQLRRQARELQRSAAGGDANARRRLGAVSDHLTLSAAQLALAREHGFSSWARLKAEVERRLAAGADAEAAPPRPAVRSWQDMREWSARLLLARTGEGVDAWNRRIAEAGLDDQDALRAWLAERGVTGYAQALLVWERFGYPEFLTADADALITGQYADRPALRPILDAVLAALPALGPVIVQARKTYVSLVSPRRTFAVVQAITKRRVDLGLRLAGVEPKGRLHAATSVGNGAMTVRISLATPDDLDGEAIAWLRRAYEQSTAPSSRRAPARPRPAQTTLPVVVHGSQLPGRTCRPGPDGAAYQAVHVALCSRGTGRAGLDVPGRPWRAAEPVPGDAPAARWAFEITVRQGADGLAYGGPFVRGNRGDRHIGLAWGEVPGDGTLRLFRGAKLPLAEVGGDVLAEAMRPGHRLVARVRLTDAKGLPICARVRPPDVAWSAEPVDA